MQCKIRTKIQYKIRMETSSKKSVKIRIAKQKKTRIYVQSFKGSQKGEMLRYSIWSYSKV